jgi:hypothetical protein
MITATGSRFRMRLRWAIGGVEADLVAIEEELLVAHGRGKVLQGRTLERLCN